jgi:L-cysteine S-thiosulfotransferase
MKRLFAITTAVLLASALPLRAGESPDRASSGEVATGSHQEVGSGKNLERRSGTSFMTPDTKAIQDDDTANPGMLWALEGEELWTKKDGTNERACADCHDDARISMKGVAARYPAFDRELGRPVDLEQRVNLCRARHQQAQPFAYESRELLALTAFLAQQSRGMPITAGSDAELAPFVARGHDLFRERQGQLNLSCANCHDDNWDKRLAGSAITQGHPTGYPLYRLEWQSLGSLQRRLRGCIIGVRAQPYAFGASELVDLELYLMTRAAGMPLESPAVRP